MLLLLVAAAYGLRQNGTDGERVRVFEALVPKTEPSPYECGPPSSNTVGPTGVCEAQITSRLIVTREFHGGPLYEYRLPRDGSRLHWRADDGREYELGFDPTHPVVAAPERLEQSHASDEHYCYRVAIDRPDYATSSGHGLVIERVDRQTGDVLRLGSGDHGIKSILPFEDDIYWGVLGHDHGGFGRVSKGGGPEETFQLLPGRWEDLISDLVGYPNQGVLVVGSTAVAWIPARRGAPRGVFATDRAIGAAIYDDGEFFIGETGYHLDPPSDYLVRVDRHNVLHRLAGPFKDIHALATRGSSVYFMVGDSTDVWAVPKTGGPARVVARGEPSDHEEKPLELWAHPCGLVLLHASRSGGTLEVVPWSLVEAGSLTRRM